MGLKLQCLRGLHNTRHPNPVHVTIGSNSFMVDRDDLMHFEDVLDNSIARNHFRESYLDPFLDLYANGDD